MKKVYKQLIIKQQRTKERKNQPTNQPNKQTNKQRLLEEPSLATTLQGVYLYIFCRYMFRPLLAIFKWKTQLFSGNHLTATHPL
jgi:hypothetical protein